MRKRKVKKIHPSALFIFSGVRVIASPGQRHATRDEHLHHLGRLGVDGAHLRPRHDNKVAHDGIGVWGIDGDHAVEAERRQILLSYETKAVVYTISIQADDDGLIELSLIAHESSQIGRASCRERV